MVLVFVKATAVCHVSLFNRPLLAPFAERRGGWALEQQSNLACLSILLILNGVLAVLSFKVVVFLLKMSRPHISCSLQLNVIGSTDVLEQRVHSHDPPFLSLVAPRCNGSNITVETFSLPGLFMSLGKCLSAVLAGTQVRKT